MNMNHNKDTFSSFHPIVNFLYFCLVIGFSMFLMHPVALAISLLCSFGYAVYQDGRRTIWFFLKFALPMMLMAAIVNPAFNHQGVTILCYLPSDNPLTLESIAYGMAAAVMLASVLFWFRCYTAVMTTDKFVYLFGRLIPSLSLVLCMALRFVPRFVAQMTQVRETQAGIGKGTVINPEKIPKNPKKNPTKNSKIDSEMNPEKDPEKDLGKGPEKDGKKGGIKQLKNAIRIFSIMVTWSLENAIETADSMNSRGYGLPGRTAFSIYRLEERDKQALLWLLFCGVSLVGANLAKGMRWRYFPNMKGVLTEPLSIGFFMLYFCLCMTPVFINKREEKEWNSSKSVT